MSLTYQIEMMWDAEARVWLTVSVDGPGLATENETALCQAPLITQAAH
ncbi:MAG: DUF1902 domain-containing protein [Spirulinaceae cyanobacterium]